MLHPAEVGSLSGFHFLFLICIFHLGSFRVPSFRSWTTWSMIYMILTMKNQNWNKCEWGKRKPKIGTDIAVHDCHSEANCTNIDGGYECTCKHGWTGNGKTCTDYEECEKMRSDGIFYTGAFPFLRGFQRTAYTFTWVREIFGIYKGRLIPAELRLRKKFHLRVGIIIR